MALQVEEVAPQTFPVIDPATVTGKGFGVAGVEYRDVSGFVGYRVGSDGSVWSCRDWKGGVGDEWRQLARRPNSKGYSRVSLRRNGRTCDRKVHRLVLEAFIGPAPDGMQGCHNDGNPSNCELGNLRWDTIVGNHADKWVHGTQTHGGSHCWAKLSDEDVGTVRSEYASGVATKHLAKRFNVDVSTIRRLVKQSYRRSSDGN